MFCLIFPKFSNTTFYTKLYPFTFNYRPYPFTFFEGYYLPQILLGPLLNTLSQIIVEFILRI